MAALTPSRFLAGEAQGLLRRLQRVRPLSATMPAVAAAFVSPHALMLIDRTLLCERDDLTRRVRRFLSFLGSRELSEDKVREAHRKFTFLKLKFNATLDHLDIFADVMTQRSEHETGSWIGGLDVAAADAMRIRHYEGRLPDAVTYLDRGHGAAIRRARTRLPGGSFSPVAVVRIPRERMVGTGIASSLVHEVGHQVAALLDLVKPLKRAIQPRRGAQSAGADPWTMWQRWISEIVADAWAIGKLGPTATAGLMGVVSLPIAFVFRMGLDDPHPFPWIRVIVSCRIGARLYPDPLWGQLEHAWRAAYPEDAAPEATRDAIRALEGSASEFVSLLLTHRVPRAGGRPLVDLLRHTTHSPARLRELRRHARSTTDRVGRMEPIRAFAYLGLARLDGDLPASREHALVGRLLHHWALTRALCASQHCPSCAARRTHQTHEE